MSWTPCNTVADHQGAADPRLKTPGLVDGSTQQKYFPSSYISYRWKAMEKSCIHEPSKEKVRWRHNKLSLLFIIHITKMYDVT